MKALPIVSLLILSLIIGACVPNAKVESSNKLTIDPKMPDSLQQIKRYEAEQTKTSGENAQTIPEAQIIDHDGASNFKALHYPQKAPRPNGDVVIWGPYETLQAGDYAAIYRISLSDVDYVIPLVSVDVTAEEATSGKPQVIAKADLPGTKFDEAGRFLIVTLPFKLTRQARVELRVRWYGQTDMDLDYRAIAIPTEK